MDGYQYIYCLPPAGGRIRSQGNYCLPPAGVLHSQNKVIKCAAYLLWSKIKKPNFTLSFASPEKDFFFYICDVITSPEKEKSSANHYFRRAYILRMQVTCTHTCSYMYVCTGVHHITRPKITLSFTSPEKEFFFIFMMWLLHRKKKKALLITTFVEHTYCECK